MAFQTKIQSLISGHTNNAGHSVESAADWTNAVNWQFSTASSDGNIYLVKMNMNDGSEIAFQQNTAYTNPFHEYPVSFDIHGTYINQFSPGIIQINSSTLAQTQTLATDFAFSQGTLSPITATDGSTWQLITGLLGQVFFENFECVRTSTTPMVIWGPGAISFANYSACGCPGIPGAGIGYVLSGDNIGSPSTSAIKLFKVNVNLGVQAGTLLSTIAASTIDAAWTTIGQNGICVDQTDGHVLAFVQGQVSAANPFYMLKLNGSTGALIWKLQIPGPGGGPQVAQSLIKRQIYALLNVVSGGSQATVINTNSGTITSQYTTGLATVVAGDQGFNDQSGAVICEVTAYTAGANAPLQLNATPSSFTGWSLLYVIAPANPAPATGTHATQLRIWGNWH